MNTLVTWIRKNRDVVNIKAIEERLEMPRGTLSYAVLGKRQVPKKYDDDIKELMINLRNSIDFALKYKPVDDNS